MNPFLMQPKEMLAQWKLLRTELKDKPEIEQLKSIVNFWHQAPLLSIAYDPEVLDTYPSPWDMMNANSWCSNSVAVGMDFTLRLGGWDSNRLRIKMIRDYENSIQKLVVEIDGKYLINYEYGCVSLVSETTFSVLDTWIFTGKHYERTECQ